ncbi:STAS domain-containing protein [Geodermatophilus sp. SYSU D00697]
MTFDATPPHPPGIVWVAREDGDHVLHLRGEIDSATVARFEEDRAEAADGPPGGVVAVDATGATFINSAGLALLVRETLPHRRAGGTPSLRNPNRTVLQALRLTGVLDLFEVARP